jgi:hypothetical protein
VIYIGIDDTDTLDTEGTNQLARQLVQSLDVAPGAARVVRHQLFFDSRIPYTSHNGSASIVLTDPGGRSIGDVIDCLRQGMNSWFVEGSDPGLCVTERVPHTVTEFAYACKSSVRTQDEARELAAGSGIHLEGLGGTEQGVIGALAAVGLAAHQCDGRIVHLSSWPWPDPFNGPLDAETILARGVDEIRCAATGASIHHGLIQIDKHLRPNLRDGRNVLFVQKAPASWPAPEHWRALKVL